MWRTFVDDPYLISQKMPHFSPKVKSALASKMLSVTILISRHENYSENWTKLWALCWVMVCGGASHSCICCNLASSSPFRSLLRHPDESCWGAECNCQVSAVLFVCNLLLAIPSYCSTLFKDRLGRISKGLMTLSKTKNGCFSSQTCQVQKSNHQMIKAIQWISFYPRVWSSRLLPPWRLKTLRRSWPKTPCFMRAASSSGGPRGKAIR